jgi:hypothetical protein
MKCTNCIIGVKAGDVFNICYERGIFGKSYGKHLFCFCPNCGTEIKNKEQQFKDDVLSLCEEMDEKNNSQFTGVGMDERIERILKYLREQKQ